MNNFFEYILQFHNDRVNDQPKIGRPGGSETKDDTKSKPATSKKTPKAETLNLFE